METNRRLQKDKDNGVYNFEDTPYQEMGSGGY
jgi:hypothetical protein